MPIQAFDKCAVPGAAFLLTIRESATNDGGSDDVALGARCARE
jgi:hypothetical protein